MISGLNPWFPILSIKLLEYALAFQNAFIDSIIEQTALKTRKLFLFQLLHINLHVNLLSLHVTFILLLYFALFFLCYFLSWIMSRSLTSQIITITTKSDNVIVEDWSKKKFIYFFHETGHEKCRAKTTQLSVSSYFLSVLASF